MEEYGTPDGMDEQEYGDISLWNNERWRWEFLRRTQEVRYQFHTLAIADFREQNPDTPIPKDLVFHEFYRFGLGQPISSAAWNVYKRLPNPFIPFEQSEIELERSFEARQIRLQTLFDIEDGRKSPWDVFHPSQIAIVFDPDKPIKPQLDGLSEYLEKCRHHSLPKDTQRIHQDKWFTYIRLIDAREAGYTWNECAMNILPEYTARTPQTARDQHRQAKELQRRLGG